MRSLREWSLGNSRYEALHNDSLHLTALHLTALHLTTSKYCSRPVGCHHVRLA